MTALRHGSIGRRLAYLRTREGLTYRELAAKTGISTAMLHRVEHGRNVPTIDVLGRWLKAFGLTFRWLDEPCEHEWICRFCGAGHDIDGDCPSPGRTAATPAAVRAFPSIPPSEGAMDEKEGPYRVSEPRQTVPYRTGSGDGGRGLSQKEPLRKGGTNPRPSRPQPPPSGI